MATAQTHKFIIQHKAYLKFFLHAAKHAHCAVNGVLLGSSSPSSPNTWLIADSIPIQHHWSNLSPMMEVGLEMAEIYAKEAGLQIVGYYYASEAAEDLQVNAVGYKILERISQDFPSACAFVFNSSIISTGQPAISISKLKKNAPNEEFDLEDSSTPSRVLQSVRETSIQLKLADFDDYLEDPKADWLRNATVL